MRNKPKKYRKTLRPYTTATDNDNDNDNDIKKKKSIRKSVACFTPPTLDEVKGYISENGYTVNADAFYNHYEAIGWKVGKNSMKDWRASVRSWQGRENNATPQQSTSTPKPSEKWLN